MSRWFDSMRRSKTRLYVLCAAVCVFMVELSLLIVGQVYNLGSEADLLIRWISPVALLLLGVFIGIEISGKRIQVRGIGAFLLFATGFLAAPFVGVAIISMPFSRGNEPLVFGGSIIAYLLLYMVLWGWFKKKSKHEETY
jgi:hypothetical protein